MAVTTNLNGTEFPFISSRTNEGPQMLELTTERRRTWLSVISRDDLKNLNNVYVCGNHFVKGEIYRLAHSLSA